MVMVLDGKVTDEQNEIWIALLLRRNKMTLLITFLLVRPLE